MIFPEQKPSAGTESTDNRLTVSLWEAISVGLRRTNQMKVLRKWSRTPVGQFLFHCVGVSGADSAEMDFTITFVLLKWPKTKVSG